MRRVKHLMGMPISIDVPSAKSEEVFETAFDLLEDIGNRFSPFKADSEVCRYQRGEIKSKDLSADMKDIIKGCKQAEKLTNGYFSANFEGKFNPTGYVKGWAIAKAGEAIEAQGYKTYCIGAGGDILAHSDSDKVWQIGIQDPRNKDKILNMLSISNGAVASSGNYERGAHIINPKTGEPANELLAITVTGPDIIMADVLATAAFAMGKAGEILVNSQAGYRAFVVA